MYSKRKIKLDFILILIIVLLAAISLISIRSAEKVLNIYILLEI